MICGYPFIFNNTPSEEYNVSLVFLGDSYTNRPSGSGVEMITDRVRRNAQLLYLDGMQAPPLDFDINVVFDDPVDIYTLERVKDWLGGEISFKKLQICAEHFDTYYFNCYIELREDLIYADGYRGVTATVHCDAPWAWQFEDVKSYILNPDDINVIHFDNLSADSEMLRPIITFTMARNGEFYIKVPENKNRVTEFKNLISGESVTIDNLNGFITSTQGVSRIANFNKVFCKIPKGTNYLECGRNANYIEIKCTNAMRIGGGYY